MKTTIRLGPRFTMPINVVTETIGILAVKRAGKSNAAVVFAEELYDAGIPWVAIDPKGDWWGVRSAGSGNAPGLEVVVFGGEHGDVPLEPGSGKLVADLVVDQRLTCVLDVSEMTKADQRRFLIAFAQQLYKKNREPMHVFCEEADEYIPQSVQGENATLVGAFERLVKRGGFRGIGITLITQRSASLNKDVLTQIGTLIALRTTSPQDRKAILGWVETHTEGREYVNALPKLANGDAVLFSPSFLDTLEVVSFRRRRTFDSGATPEIGKKIRPPARLADVDLAAIEEAMVDTIEKAKASDPKELQKRIVLLEREKREYVEDLKKWHDRNNEMQHAMDAHVCTQVPLDGDVKELQKTLHDFVKELDVVLAPWQKHLLEQVSATQVITPTKTWSPPSRRGKTERVVVGGGGGGGAARPREAVADSGGDVKLGKTEKKLLAVLITHGPRTYKQLALQSGYSARASTISVALGKLRKAGLVEPGQPITATQLAIDTYGHTLESLPTGPELYEWWRSQLGKTENAILEHFINCYPNATTHAETAEATGYSPVASTISVALGKLRRLEIVDGWKVSDDFMRSIQ